MIIKKEVEDSLVSFFDEIYQGNKAAIDLSMMLFLVSQVWDDVVDGDDLDRSSLNDAFTMAMISIPTNPVYLSVPALPFHIYNVFLRWRDSTEIENNSPSDADLNKCYMLRAGIYDIFVLIAAALYGDNYAKEIGPKVRRFYGENLIDYKSEFNHA